MKTHKALGTLILLAMMTSQAVAEEVCLDGDTVIGIKDLVVDTHEYGRVSIDVDFGYTSGYEIYGSALDQFPFHGGGATKYEDAFSINQAINAALDANNPVPDSAGQSDQTAYFTWV